MNSGPVNCEVQDTEMNTEPRFPYPLGEAVSISGLSSSRPHMDVILRWLRGLVIIILALAVARISILLRLRLHRRILCTSISVSRFASLCIGVLLLCHLHLRGTWN